VSRDELVAAAMRAFKDKPLPDTTALGLTWLRVPMERAVAAIEPLVLTELRTKVAMLRTINVATGDFGRDYTFAIDEVLHLIDGSSDEYRT
jgi:hypothetical protein